MFIVGVFLVVMAVFINLFNYFGEAREDAASNEHPFMQNIKASALVMVGSCIMSVADCSSHFAKMVAA